MTESQPKQIIVPKGTLLPNEPNVIEIPEGCEDSRVLIAKLQAKLARPPRYYPPLTNPENKFERRIGDRVVGRGLPPLSPLQEERRNYVSSFKEYGRGRKVYGVSREPTYFEKDTTYDSRNISGKFDYCPSSTPIPDHMKPAIQYPSPRLSPIRLGRDLFAPDPSVYRSTATPQSSPPRPASPPPRSPSPPRRLPVRKRLFSTPPQSESCDKSCSLSDVSNMLSLEQPNRQRSLSRRSPSPLTLRQPSPARLPPGRKAAAPPPRRADVSDKSYSLEDASDLPSFEASRGLRSDYHYIPESIKVLSKLELKSIHSTISDELNYIYVL